MHLIAAIASFSVGVFAAYIFHWPDIFGLGLGVLILASFESIMAWFSDHRKKH
jgi:hypothetical protein